MSETNRGDRSHNTIPSLQAQIDAIVEPELLSKEMQVAIAYDMQKKIDIASLGIERVRISISDSDFGYDVEGVQDSFDITPILFTTHGVLCSVDGAINEFDEPEYLLIEGSIMVADPQVIIDTVENSAFLFTDWPDVTDKKAHSKSAVRDSPAIFSRHLIIGSHISWRHAYSPKGMNVLELECAFNDSPLVRGDFSKIEGHANGENIILSVPYYSFVTPGTINGIDIEMISGKEYSFK
jgi:hypothetical protein